jgi:fibrillarin-like pre-rRNA processing protein
MDKTKNQNKSQKKHNASNNSFSNSKYNNNSQKKSRFELESNIKSKLSHLSNLIFFRKNIYTKNKIPNQKVYDEKTIYHNQDEYRLWDPKKSKVCAAIHNNCFPEIKEDSKILYLGAASGTTVSHLSDIVPNGLIYAVEFSEIVIQNLIHISNQRKNIIPILADANNPVSYLQIMNLVDVIIQDVSQKNQVEILVKNAKLFLKKKGVCYLALKTRSIDISKSARQISVETKKDLTDFFNNIEMISLEPFEKEHFFYDLKGFNFDDT